MLELQSTGVQYHINGVLDRLISKAHKLITNETNNAAELFMSFVAKYNAGKRLNLTQRGSFESRAHISGMQYNEGVNWQVDPWTQLMEESPGTNFKSIWMNVYILSEKTVGQWDNPVYEQIRRNRLTASNFGSVIKRRKTTKPDNLVKRLLSSRQISTVAMEYVYINDEQPLYVDAILRDRELWNNIMLPKLTQFYESYVLEAVATRNITKQNSQPKQI
ncbi:hypothetical protein NQ315_015322 [Exocentrus adspersus]|uniref:Uncharacterized protein n=1 Tax=Exocentrus adspersus TaxID=1586481 RepID=A0AAV8V6Z7_9CUCU|nr:hypothetical protein NQ315_015322 [Exocentrus adspersus]